MGCELGAMIQDQHMAQTTDHVVVRDRDHTHGLLLEAHTTGYDIRHDRCPSGDIPRLTFRVNGDKVLDDLDAEPTIGSVN